MKPREQRPKARPAKLQRRRRNRPRSEVKRNQIVRAARTLFLRDGYARSSIDMIAVAAGVSKRTLYSHFENKENLFLAIVEETTIEVTQRLVDLIDEQLAVLENPARQLTELGRALAASSAQFSEYQSLVSLVVAEARRSPAIANAWLALGQEPVNRALSAHLSRFAAAGLLEIEDADEAAAHFTALVTQVVTLRSVFGAVPLRRAEVDALVESGVAAFLRIYGRQPSAEA